jgi:hypothetical protein
MVAIAIETATARRAVAIGTSVRTSVVAPGWSGPPVPVAAEVAVTAWSFLSIAARSRKRNLGGRLTFGGGPAK